MTDQADCVSRRLFVSRMSQALAGIPLLSVAGACATAAVHRVAASDGVLRLAVADLPELAADGGVARVEIEGEDASLFIVRDQNSYHALSPICTHRGCTVEARSARFVCPCHGSTYSRTGAVLRGPAEEPLASFPVNATDNGATLIVDRRRSRS